MEAVRKAAGRRDMQALEAALSSHEWVLDPNVMIEFLVEEDPPLAQCLWDAGTLFENMFVWQPVVSEIVERGTQDPIDVVETCIPHTINNNESPVPFAVANMLLRTNRGELAKKIADRWIHHPMKVRAIELGVTSDLERRRAIRDEMRALYVDEGAPREWDTILVSCEAQCEETDEFTPLMLTNYGLSHLNTPLICEVPRHAKGAFALYLVRAHNEHNVVWSFVVAGTEEEAARWGGARVYPENEHVEVQRLYSVDSPHAGFCFPASAHSWIVERSVGGVGMRTCSDKTGLAVRRHFYESLHRTKADEMAMFDRVASGRPQDNEQDDKHDDKHNWPVPPAGSRLSQVYQQALDTGLFA